MKYLIPTASINSGRHWQHWGCFGEYLCWSFFWAWGKDFRMESIDSFVQMQKILSGYTVAVHPKNFRGCRRTGKFPSPMMITMNFRSEERRVGKEYTSRR